VAAAELPPAIAQPTGPIGVQPKNWLAPGVCTMPTRTPALARPAIATDGLRPPSQMRFVFRQERRMQVAWAFPSPQEQVALHA